MIPELLTLLAALVAGAIASLSGFGIGSILTPLLAAWLGTKLAVAAVSVPHFVGTALRFALIREHLDRRVLVTFGIASAVGGLLGALLHIWLRSVILSYVLGGLLAFAGLMGLTGIAQRMRFGRTTAWIAGILQYRDIASAWSLVLIATVGVVVGTLAGKPLLQRIPEKTFRTMVSVIILALGIWMLIHPGE